MQRAILLEYTWKQLCGYVFFELNFDPNFGFTCSSPVNNKIHLQRISLQNFYVGKKSYFLWKKLSNKYIS